MTKVTVRMEPIQDILYIYLRRGHDRSKIVDIVGIRRGTPLSNLRCFIKNLIQKAVLEKRLRSLIN